MQAASKRLVPVLLLAALVGCAAPTPAAVTGVTIDGGDRTIAVGDSHGLTATVASSGGAGTAVAWTSGTESVAAVDATGRVTGFSAGSSEITAASTFDPGVSDAVTVTVVAPGVLAWTTQFGTSATDNTSGIATDAEGNQYIVGRTSGSLEGTYAGSFDAFIRSQGPAGTHRWTRQFGNSFGQSARAVATDAKGNAYVAGDTGGTLEGAGEGLVDAFLRSYAGDGALRWTRQFGTSGLDYATGIATDGSGNVYAAGYTDGDLAGTSAGGFDAFVRSYDEHGTLRWTRQFGSSSDDRVSALAMDASGAIYVTGTTHGNLARGSAGGRDAFLRSYTAEGTVRWTRQFGTVGEDFGVGVATGPAGNVYAVGFTNGALGGASAGGDDAFVRSYDEYGILRWTRQFGTSTIDGANGVATDANANVYITGGTTGALEGAHAGSSDAFVRTYDGDGNYRWSRQFGTNVEDHAWSTAVGPNGNVYLVGYTTGAIVGTSFGGTDAFVRKYGP